MFGAFYHFYLLPAALLWLAGVCFFSPFALAQKGADTLLLHSEKIIALKAQADELEMDDEGNIFILDKKQNRLTKYLKIAQYDSSISVGGLTRGGEGLNQPVDIQAPSRNVVYLLDRDNRRALLYNVNLKIVRSYDYNSQTFQLPDQNTTTQLSPQNMAVSPSGDFFLLNADDAKVYKIDNFNRLTLLFGGANYGEGSLYQPDGVLINTDSYVDPFVFVSDTSRQEAKVFDVFGVYQHTLKPALPFRWFRIRLFDKYVLFIGQNAIAVYHTVENSLKTLRFSTPDPLPILDARARRDGLYLLNKTGVLRFKL